MACQQALLTAHIHLGLHHLGDEAVAAGARSIAHTWAGSGRGVGDWSVQRVMSRRLEWAAGDERGRVGRQQNPDLESFIRPS